MKTNSEFPQEEPLTAHNVLDYGADRSGNADSNHAIQAALEAAMKGPCRGVYLPDGIYRIGSGLSIDTGATDDTWNIHVFSHGGATLKAVVGVTVFTVKGCKKSPPDNMAPRRVHFEKLHLIREPETQPITNTEVEVGFYLAAPECRLDDVEVSEFRGAGIRLSGADLTSLHRCRLWHNRVNLEDIGASQATELVGCRLIYAQCIGRAGVSQGTGLVWNSRGLTVLGGAIEQNEGQEVLVGNELDSIARFYGVHFEHKTRLKTNRPMIVCGEEHAVGNVQAAFDRCVFFGNGTDRVAIAFQQGVKSGEVIDTRFQNFRRENAPIKVFSAPGNYYERALVVVPARGPADPNEPILTQQE
jgi:hypothetical protein